MYADFSDVFILQKIGSFIQNHRMNQNLTQNELSHQAGISRSTLSLLERGESVNLLTLIQVLRTLDQLHVLQGLFEELPASPMQLAQENQKTRYRVRKPKSNPDNSESTW